MANVEREISFDKTLVTGSRLVTAGNEDIRDDLTGCGRAVDGKCGFVGGPCRASHAQALRKSEEPRIQGHNRRLQITGAIKEKGKELCK